MTQRRWWTRGGRLGWAAALLLALPCVAQEAAPAAGRPALLFMSGRVEVKPFGNPNKYRVRTFLPDARLQGKLKEWGYTWGGDFFSTGMTLDDLRQFNAVVMLDFPNALRFRTSETEIRRVEALLRQYVEEGGGLFLTSHVQASQWGLEQNTEELNRFLAPWGAKVLIEQVDEQNPTLRLPKPHRSGVSGLAWTDHVTSHPLTQGVTGFLYPSDHGHMCYYTHPVEAGPEWTVLLRASATARSATARLGAGGNWRKRQPGTIASAPALLAVREAGRGRVVLWPTIPTATLIDGYHRFWGSGLTMVSLDANHPSEGETLIRNLLAWLTEPSRGRFGGYDPPPPQAEKEPGLHRIYWDKIRPAGRNYPHTYKGLIGMRSALSTGNAQPAAMLAAARDAGYDFAAFGDELAELTAEELERLRQTCLEHCNETFQAFAGFTYRDGSGNAWQVFGNTLHWPKDDWWHDRAAKTIAKNNVIFRGYQCLPVLMVHPNRNPERPWYQGNFKGLAVHTYEGGRLLDDATDVYRRLQGDDFKLWPAAVHIVRSVEEVRQAASAALPQSYVLWHELGDVISAYSGLAPKYRGANLFRWTPFVSSGPLLEAWRVLNFGTSDLAIPGNDRFRMHVRVVSDRGLREVRILDGRQPRQRFLLSGAKEWEHVMDGFHDRNHHFLVRAEDVDGRWALSADRGTSIQELNVPRCTDNLNTYSAGKFKAQKVFPVRGLENYIKRQAGNVGYFPLVLDVEAMKRPAVEQQLTLVSRFGWIKTDVVDCFYPPTATPNANQVDIPERADPAGPVKGQVTMTLFTPWPDSTTVALVQGAFEVQRDLDARRREIQVYQVPWVDDAESFAISMRDSRALVCSLKPRKSRRIGTFDSAEYAANIGSFSGARALAPLAGHMKYYALRQGTAERPTFGLMGRLPLEDRTLAKGDTFTYQYLAIWSEVSDTADNTFVEEVFDQLGLRGQTAYTVTPSHGFVMANRFILSLKAKAHGFAGTISQAALPLLLPVFVEGLNARWPAGIWYKGKHTFAEPVWSMDAVHNRYAKRASAVYRDRLVRFGVVDGRGMLQVDTEHSDKDVYIGNLLVCDHPEVFLELEDWRKGREIVTANNPTDTDLTTMVKPGPGFALIEPFELKLTIPAGGFMRVGLNDPAASL